VPVSRDSARWLSMKTQLRTDNVGLRDGYHEA
jgi:hypothetical protein